jgi:MFS transporter, OPA family, glycerol-3-phosphate transporter
MPRPAATRIFVQHPPGFRARRGVNWAFVGLLYTSFYTCRYNFAIANKSISDEFGFNKTQTGTIITTALLAYAFGLILNGLLTDYLGGKRAMLIGAAATAIMNTIFGFASFWGLLWLFALIRGIDGYFQSFGAPGMVKINTAWFAHTERGRFAGIFGFMINAGRFLINTFGPSLLVGFVFLGLWYVPPLHWRWLFWIPAMLISCVAMCMALVTEPTPRDAGFAHFIVDEVHDTEYVRAPMREVFSTVAANPVVWIIGFAYACTGSVRQSVDQWYLRLMQDVHHLDLGDVRFKILGVAIPLVASMGSLISGYVSDTIFEGRRAPVAAGFYFLETMIVLAAAQFHSANAAILSLVFISLTANGTHSILGTASAMDLGGARMSGFAAGLIDSFQYFGGSLAGFFLGKLLDLSWGWYFYFMAPFGVIGGALMISVLGRVSSAKPKTL